VLKNKIDEVVSETHDDVVITYRSFEPEY